MEVKNPEPGMPDFTGAGALSAAEPTKTAAVAEPELDLGTHAEAQTEPPSTQVAGASAANSESGRRGRPVRARTNDETLRDAAVHLIGRDGWDALTLSAVARHADLTLGAIYSRFENKSELGLDLWTTRVLPHFRQSLRQIELALAAPGDSSGFLSLVHKYLDGDVLHTGFTELVQAATFDTIMRDVIFDDIQEALTPWLRAEPATSARNAYLIGALIGMSLLRPVVTLDRHALDQTAPEIWRALQELSQPANLNSEQWLPLVMWTPSSDDPTREQIHTSFIATVAKSGYEHATISRVCRAAGISSGSLFSRFESKAEVFADAYQTLMLAAIGQDALAMEKVAAAEDSHLAYAEYVLARLRPEHRAINIVHLEFLRLAARDVVFRASWDDMQRLYDRYYDEHYEAKAGQESLAMEQKFLRASARWGLRFLSLACTDIWQLPMDVVNVSLSRLPDYFQPRRPESAAELSETEPRNQAIVHRRRSGRALQNDEKLRHSAIRTIAAIGWSDTSLTHVAKSAGLTLGAVYSRYEDKSDLGIDLWRSHGAAVLAEAADLAVRACAQPPDDQAWQRLLEPDELTGSARVVAMELAIESLFNPDLFAESRQQIAESIAGLLAAANGRTTYLYWFAAAMGLLQFKAIDSKLPGQVHSLDTLRTELWVEPSCPVNCDGGPKPELRVDIAADDPYEFALLEGAREVLSERGFDQSTIAAICRRAGISSGSLFGRYATKVDLITDCVRRTQLSRIEQQGLFQRQVLADAPPSLRANNYITGVLSPWNRQTRRCFLEFSRIARTHDDARLGWIAMMDELNETVTKHMPDMGAITKSGDGLIVSKAALWGLRLFTEFEPSLATMCYCPAVRSLDRAVAKSRKQG